MVLRCNNKWMNRPTNGWMDKGGSVPLVHVAAFDWPSLPSSPPPASGRHSRDRRAGEMCELNATRRLMAHQCGSFKAVHPWDLAQATATTGHGHRFVTATVLAGCNDQGHDFLTTAYDHVRSSSFLADILTSWVLIWVVHIIRRSTDFYIVTKI